MMTKDQVLLEKAYQTVVSNKIPQLVIDSMMEGKPENKSEEEFLKITLERLKGIVWSDRPSTFQLAFNQLAVLHPIYHPWFDTTQEIQGFVKEYKKAVLNKTKLPQEYSFVQQDIDKTYNVDVDEMMKRRPLIMLQKGNRYSIIDGNHRFWGKAAQELRKDENIEYVSVNAFVGRIMGSSLL
jgi:hypothetical protein